MYEIFIAVTIAILAGGVIYLAKVITSFLGAEEKELQSDEEVDNFLRAEMAVATVTEVCVGKLEAVVAKELRQKIKDNETDEAELYALAEDAYTEIISMIAPELLAALEGSINNVDLYIKNQIENQLLLLKARLNGGVTCE